MNLNKVIIAGRVGQDPEISYFGNNNEKCSVKLSIATNESWKDKATGEKVEKTEWHNIVMYGKIAETVDTYVKKGSQIYLEGKLQTKSWDDKETGKKRYKTEINANVFQFVGSKKDNDNKSAISKKPNHLIDDDFDDDIPF